jgi:transcriptional regulator with XRE-family HTH domain
VNENAKPLSEWLRAYNRSEVARIIGVDQGTLSRWYRGTQIPSGDKLLAIAAFLKIDPRLIDLSHRAEAA